MTKKELAKAIAEEVGLPVVQVQEIVQKAYDGIIEALVTEGRIELRNFGVFQVKERKLRKARNPKTGETVDVPGKNGRSVQGGQGDGGAGAEGAGGSEHTFHTEVSLNDGPLVACSLRAKW